MRDFLSSTSNVLLATGIARCADALEDWATLKRYRLRMQLAALRGMYFDEPIPERAAIIKDADDDDDDDKPATIPPESMGVQYAMQTVLQAAHDGLLGDDLRQCAEHCLCALCRIEDKLGYRRTDLEGSA